MLTRAPARLTFERGGEGYMPSIFLQDIELRPFSIKVLSASLGDIDGEYRSAALIIEVLDRDTGQPIQIHSYQRYPAGLCAEECVRAIITETFEHELQECLRRDGRRITEAHL